MSLSLAQVAVLWLSTSLIFMGVALLNYWRTQHQVAQQAAYAALEGVESRLDSVVHEMRLLGAPATTSGCDQAQTRALVQASLSSRFVRRFWTHQPKANFRCGPTGPEEAERGWQADKAGLRIHSTQELSLRLIATHAFGEGGADGQGWLVQAQLDERIFEGAAGRRQSELVPHNIRLLGAKNLRLATLSSAAQMRAAHPDDRDEPLMQAQARSDKVDLTVSVELMSSDMVSGSLTQALQALLMASFIAAAFVAFTWRQAVRRSRLVSRIATGLKKRQYEPHVQPIVDLASGHCMGAEVLMRWHHPHRGVLSPFEFIEEAERTGQIVEMSDLVMTRAAQRLAYVARQNPHMYFSFNVTPQQLRTPGFLQRLEEIFNADTLPRQQVLLELTERDFVDQATQRALNALHWGGWRIAIDDFGTGQSSLATLEQLKIDRIKIDRAFVRTIDEHTVSRPVLDAIISLAGQLQVRLIAEGVETQAQWDYLLARGVPYAQGYHFAKPMQIEDFVRWTSRRAAELTGQDQASADDRQTAQPAAASEMLDSQAKSLWERMRSSKDMEIGTRFHALRRYENCFVGRKAVDWLVQHEGLTRAQAVKTGERLVAQGLVRHVLDEHDFKDADLFYCLTGTEVLVEEASVPQELTETLKTLRGPRWREQTRGLLVHASVVSGRELLDWMLGFKPVARDQAQRWANQWMRNGVIRHVYDDQPVRDDGSLYRLG